MTPDQLFWIEVLKAVVEVVKVVGIIAGGLLGLYAARQSHAARKEIGETRLEVGAVRKEVNGKVDELVGLAKKASYAEGKLEVLEGGGAPVAQPPLVVAPVVVSTQPTETRVTNGERTAYGRRASDQPEPRTSVPLERDPSSHQT